VGTDIQGAKLDGTYHVIGDRMRGVVKMTQPASGGSTLVTFEIAGGRKAAFRVCNAVKTIRISNNLGDAKSLVTHPATTTHQRLKPEARAELGISEGFIRFSAGLEHPDDLIEDLHAALDEA